MEEETQTLENDTQTKDKPESTQQSEAQYSEIELEAMKLGWQPKEEFEANPANTGKKWRTAEDFLDRQSFFDRLEEQKRHIKRLEQGLQASFEYNKRIERLAYEKALRDLKAERAKAVEEGNLEKLAEIHDQMDDLKEKKRLVETAPVPVNPQASQAEAAEKFAKWVEKNPWYQQDLDMRVFADGYAQYLWSSGVRDPDVALPMLEKKVREAFSQKFRNPNKDRAPALESGSRAKETKKDDFTLTEDEERILRTMLRAGAPITREEYIKQLKALRR